MKKRTYLYLCLFILIFIFTYVADAFEFPKWFPFNHDKALEEWTEKIFKDKVLYVVEPKLEGGYLQAKSNEASSGLLYRIKFQPKKLPLMSWYWKVTEFPKKEIKTETGGGWIERDDFAARVYVIFASWNLFNIQSLEYIWAENIPEGTVIASPYFKNLKLIVVESGRDNMGNWVFEKRNIYDDYKMAFGRIPKRKVSAIALMTDSDNTLSTAEAFYKDIKVGYENGKEN